MGWKRNTESPADLTDTELMAQVRAGREAAFVELVHRHQEPLLNFFRRMGASTTDAEDLVQETFLRLFKARARYRPTAKFTTFLYTLARHARIDILRRLQRHERTQERIREHMETRPATSCGHAARGMDIESALAGLSEKLRAAVVMNLCQGLTYREVADILDIPIGTVRSRLHLALKQMRETLNEQEAVARQTGSGKLPLGSARRVLAAGRAFAPGEATV